jgi:hypothetical protein
MQALIIAGGIANGKIVLKPFCALAATFCAASPVFRDKKMGQIRSRFRTDLNFPLNFRHSL